MPDEIALVLRFRDLAPRIPGHTIARHQEIVVEHGYTWWGWWAKQTEQIPVQLWSDLAAQIQAQGPARAFLVDSGERRLYETAIEEVRFDVSRIPIPAPEDGARTPAYYTQPVNGAAPTLPAWFKLATIKDADAAVLQSLVWRDEPHDDGASPEKATLIGRRIASIAELLQFGNITYWVASPAGADALPSRGELLHTRVLPVIAPRHVVFSANNRVLHISDLHVAAARHAYAIEKAEAHHRSLAAVVAEALQPGQIPGLVIVTGDLTWTGARDEFDNAFRVLEDLRGYFGLSREHFVIIPGNHDIQWSSDPAAKKAYRHRGAVSVASAVAKKNYADFFGQWYGVAPNEWFSLGRRFFLAGGPTLDILGVNSSALQAIEGAFAGLGRVTEAAVVESAKLFEWVPQSERVAQRRFYAVHHHVMPVYQLENAADARKGFGLALDAGSQLHLAMTYGVDLILHGHQHHPFAGFTKTEEIGSGTAVPGIGVLVLGAGSAGVVDEHLGPIKQRSFNLLTVDVEDVTVDMYTAGAATGRFAPLTRLSARYGVPWTRRPL
jgi:predicted phosphodiesterase